MRWVSGAVLLIWLMSDGGDKGWLSHYAPDASQAGFLTCAKPHSDSVE